MSSWFAWCHSSAGMTSTATTEPESNTNLTVPAELESNPKFPRPADDGDLTEPEQPGEVQEDGQVPRTEPEFSSAMVKDATVEVRRGFIGKVYSILTAQLLLTVIVAAPLAVVASPAWLVANQWLLWLSLAMTFIMVCTIPCCTKFSRRYPTNYVLLFVFTAFMGGLVGFIGAQYTWQSVVLAVGMTALIFACMTIFAWKSKTDFTGCGPYLVGALIVMIVFGFAVGTLALSGVEVHWAQMAYSLIGVIIFTLFMVYDTQRIIGLRGGHKHQFGIDDYVFASLSLYLDIINLLFCLLALLGDRP